MRTTWTGLSDKLNDFLLKEIFTKIRVAMDDIIKNINEIQIALSDRLSSCRVFHNADQAVTTGAGGLVLAFNSEHWDTDNLHDNVTNNARIFINKSGKWAVGVNIRYEANAAGYRGVQLVKVPTLVIGSSIVQAAPVNPTDLGVHVIYEFNVGDEIKVFTSQNSGGNLNVVSANDQSPEFWAHRLS